MDIVGFLRQYRPSMSREEIAVALGISVATLTRRMRDGLNADEVIKAAEYVGASPVEALLAVELIQQTDVARAAARHSLDAISDRELLEELLTRAADREATDEADRAEAGLPPTRATRIDIAHLRDVDVLAVDDVAAFGLAARRGEHDE